MSDFPSASDILVGTSSQTDVPVGQSTRNGVPAPQRRSSPPSSSGSSQGAGSTLPELGLDSILAIAHSIQSTYSPQNTGMPGVQEILSRLSSAMYDPTQDLKSVAEQSVLANTLPTEARMSADAAAGQAQGADYLLQQLQGVPVPQQGQLSQPNLPTLDLPGAPQTARPQVNPLTSLIALGAGFAAPSAAGQFHAAALEGAIKGAQQENVRRQQANKDEITRRSLVYDASMTAAREQQRVVEINRDAAFQNSVLTTDRQLSLAKAKGEQFISAGAAKSLKDFADTYDPAIKAGNAVKALYQAIDTKGKASEREIKSISEMLTAVEKAGAPNAAMGRDVFNSYMRASLQHQQEVGMLQRENTHHKNMMEQIMLQNDAIGNREIKVQSVRDAGSLNRLLIGEAGKDRRVKEYRDFLKTVKPSQSLKESQDNQKRLQTNLQKIEQAIAEANASRNQPKADNDALAARVDSLRGSLKETTDLLQKEQLRGARYDPTRPPDTDFDPDTGERTLR